MRQFPLSNDPIDYQVSLHINNLFNKYGRFHILTSLDFIKCDILAYEIVYENLRPTNDYDKMNVAIYNLIRYYGINKFDEALFDLFGEVA